MCSNMHKYHPRCFKKVNIGDKLCKICLFNELPFANYEIDIENIDSADTNTAVPSTIPNSIFECFKTRGLHFVHLNARSVFKKLSEVRIIARETNPAVLSITESWLDESHSSESISIQGYNSIRRDRISHAGGVLMYVRSDLAYNHRKYFQTKNWKICGLNFYYQKQSPYM